MRVSTLLRSLAGLCRATVITGWFLDRSGDRPELVIEVSYDHMQGKRFRHTGHFKRWRPDKPPAECTYEQLDVAAPYELEKIFGAR